MDTESLRSYLARACLAVLALACVLVTASPLRAQTFSVIHNFTGDADGDNYLAWPNHRSRRQHGGHVSRRGQQVTREAVYKLMHSGAGMDRKFTLQSFRAALMEQTPES